MNKQLRIIKSEIENDILIVKIPQFGYEIYYKLIPTTTLDPITRFEDNLPDIITSVNLEYVKMIKSKNSKNHDEVLEILKKESIIPQSLIYDHILLGFVYSNSSDPNNHRWWLDFRDKKNNSVYNYFADKINIQTPITTKSWHDPNPEGIWHGRMVFSKNEIIKIIELEPGNLTIQGRLRSECKPLDTNKICSPQNIPEKTNTLRLRYNIREDVWFCDLLDSKNKEIGQIPCKNIICDAKMYGEVVQIGEKPRVNIRINVTDVSEIAVAINSLIIRSK